MQCFLQCRINISNNNWGIFKQNILFSLLQVHRKSWTDLFHMYSYHGKNGRLSNSKNIHICHRCNKKRTQVKCCINLNFWKINGTSEFFSWLAHFKGFLSRDIYVRQISQVIRGKNNNLIRKTWQQMRKIHYFDLF